MTLGAQALAYAAHGLAVFPLEPRGKKPLADLVPHGVKEATRDPETITRWWSEQPDANIGIAAGQASGVVIFDVDGDKGAESYVALTTEHGSVPRTPVVATGKGSHLYFRQPEPMGNRAAMMPGLDLRGDGGYVVAPPSVHPSGDIYQWAIDFTEPFAEMPAWMLALARQPVQHDAISADDAIPEGKRNDTAFRDAAAMRRRGLGEDAIFAALRADTRYQPPLSDRELKLVAKSASRYAPDKEATADDEFRERMRKKPSVDELQAEAIEIVEEDPSYIPGIEMLDVQPEAVAWLWRPYIPAGKLVILDGDPGLGKSTLFLDLLARWSRGDVNPDGSAPDGYGEDGFGGVVMSVEDGLADTVQPRLLAQGADLSKIRAIVEIKKKGVDLSVTIPDDIPLIEKAIRLKKARFMIIDPIMAVLSSTVDAHKDQDIRAKALQPLKELAERTDCTIGLIRHLNKVSGSAAVYRGGGSIGIIGAMRSAMIVGKDPDDPDGHGRVFAHAKSNLARSGPSWKYGIEEGETVGRLVWQGQSDKTADQLVMQDLREQPKKAEAIRFLRDMLANGPMAVKELQEAAKNDGVNWATVKAAKDAVGVEAERVGFGGGGRWYIKGLVPDKENE